VVKLSELKKYTREQLKGFFEWQMLSCLKHFPNDYNCEDEAKAFAFSRPHADGFITFKSKYRGKRFFWVKKGEVVEIDPMECYLRTLPQKPEEIQFKEPSQAFKKIIQKMLYSEKK
jgi:hypothetical protein